MNRYQPLFTTSQVSIGRFDHPQMEAHQDPPREQADRLSANLVEAGSFEVHVGGRCWRLQPGDVFFTYPGLTYRCRHDHVANDRCLSIDYAHEFAPTLADQAGRNGIPTVARAGNRLKYLYSRMLAQFKTDPAALAVEGTAADVLHVLRQPVPRAPYRDAQLAWYAERIEAARDLLDGQSNRQHSLAALARNAGMSTFHFARIFSELTGMPPHRYLLERRLDRAAWHLRQGASVTETCFAVGFHNLSHFIRRFERRFGLTPAAYSRRGRN